MKTYQQWEESRKSFTDFANPGDEIDEKMYWYFLEVLPPAKMTHYGFLVGEPYSHNQNNNAQFLAFYEAPGGKKFYYGGIKTIKQFMDPSEPKYTL